MMQMSGDKPLRRRRSARGARWWRRTLRWLLQLRGSPPAIARGAAIGVFVGCSPLLGLQMVFAVLLATLFNANRVIAAAATWITNPLTFLPLYSLCYWVGSRFWPGPPVTHVRDVLSRTLAGVADLDVRAVYNQAFSLLTLSRDIAIPLTLGGFITGVIVAAPTYFVALLFVQRIRRLHWPDWRHRRSAESHTGAPVRDSSPTPRNSCATTDHQAR